jgi:hypothetical protein
MGHAPRRAGNAGGLVTWASWVAPLLALSTAGGAGALAYVSARPVSGSPSADLATPRAVEASAIRIDSARGTPWWHAAPFRRSRRLAAERYDARRQATAEQVAVQVPPRPRLALRGVVWGGDTAAVIEGVPGRDAPIVVRAGDTIGGLRVRSISPRRVSLAGLDTTWLLSLPETSP